MSKKTKSKSADKDSNAILKVFRHGISILKKSGLIPKSVDARSVKPTRHYKSLLKEFADVVTGRVKAVKVHKDCDGVSCPTVKKGRNLIALVDVSDKRQPKVVSTKKGIKIIETFFGTKVMDVVIRDKAEKLLDLEPEEIDQLELDHTATKKQSYIFTIKDKNNAGKEYMSKIRFQSLDKLIQYMGLYQHGSGGASFKDATITIRLMGDEDISNFQKEQEAATAKAKKERANARRRESRARKAGNGATRNII